MQKLWHFLLVEINEIDKHRFKLLQFALTFKQLLLISNIDRFGYKSRNFVIPILVHSMSSVSLNVVISSVDNWIFGNKLSAKINVFNDSSLRNATKRIKLINSVFYTIKKLLP